MITTTDRTHQVVERLFAATLGALELFSVYLGAELGLYRALERHGALTPDELAEHAGIAPRYAREWLEQKAVAGLLDARGDRFELPAEHVRLLTHADDPAHVAPFAHMLVGVGRVLPRVADAIAMAKAFPHATVEGFDADPASIADARRHAGPGVTFVEGDATAVRDRGSYDLVLVLETLHDPPHPIATPQAVRAGLAPGGTALIVDERVAATFTAPGDEVERMMYGWSVTHCLPTQMVDRPSAALGTVLRPGTVRELAVRAGFDGVEVLPVDNDFFRLYRLTSP